jgi:hypothetical protein
MKVYDKDFLVEVYMSRFVKMPNIEIDMLCKLEDNANKLFDRVGKDEFRKYSDVTPARIREFQTQASV